MSKDKLTESLEENSPCKGRGETSPSCSWLPYPCPSFLLLSWAELGWAIRGNALKPHNHLSQGPSSSRSRIGAEVEASISNSNSIFSSICVSVE
ncbi:GD23244 [Drosophila simulans]|uniref:GD23244 n=1 Tax=Drosophila simulans TaxID=7240 RepID=B4Q9M7_DROSI|nr:GD23244 [Drosophila simulans]